MQMTFDVLKNWGNLGQECPDRGFFLVKETFKFT